LLYLLRMAAVVDPMNIYVDPGKFHAALSLYKRKKLIGAALLRSSRRNPAEAALDLGQLARVFWKTRQPRSVLRTVKCEQPAIWLQGGFRGDPNDILYLMATNGAIIRALNANYNDYITTNDWKGQTPKKIIEFRVRKRLSAEEIDVIGEVTDHNIIDAVGIGLWDLKRM